jgi:alkyl sulfatase BDS1-like metallo-beta-lactamase superfamily hydrolase
MKDFIASNPGLQSRFNRYIHFPDYTPEELVRIFESNMKKYDYLFAQGAKEHLQHFFEQEVANKDANFGNGRWARNVFEKTIARQDNRLARELNLTLDKLTRIRIEDLP